MALKRITTPQEAVAFKTQVRDDAVTARRYDPALAAHLVPFCQRYDSVKAQYAPEAERIKYVQRVAREAYDKMLACGDINGINKKKLGDAVAASLPNHKPRVQQWLKEVTERAELPELGLARLDLDDRGLGWLDRYCRKSGARLSQSDPAQVQMLSALLDDDARGDAYEAYALRRDQIILQHHGISLAWYDTSPMMLERLRSVDPAGYVVYLLGAWQHGKMQADTLEELGQRIDAYEALKERDDVMEFAGIVELLAKTSFAVKDEALTLQAIAAMDLATLRQAACSFIVKMIKRTTKQAQKDKARLSMSVFYRLQAASKVPSAIKKVRRGKRTPEGSTALGIWALSHSDGVDPFDELDFELTGALSHELTLQESEDELYAEHERLESEVDDMLDSFIDADTVSALEGIPTVAEMVVRAQKSAAGRGESADKLPPHMTLTGDVFDSVFE